MIDAEFWSEQFANGRWNFSVPSSLKKAVRDFNSAFVPAFDNIKKGYCVLARMSSSLYKPAIYGVHRQEHLMGLLRQKRRDMSDIAGAVVRRETKAKAQTVADFEKTKEAITPEMAELVGKDWRLRKRLTERGDAVKLDGSGPNHGSKYYGAHFTR